jgi:putative transposase
MAEGYQSRVLLQEFAHLRKQFWGKHLWARGYLAVSSGTITDSMIEEYIKEQEGEPIYDDSHFKLTIIRTYHLPGGSCSFQRLI